MVNDAELPREEVTGLSTPEEVDWSTKEPVPGLEHLGRAIVDAQGQPSGSPANYEVTRGATDQEVLPPAADVVASIAKEFENYGQPPAAPQG